jgi:RNA polymerase sigma-70 factor (ECF subfamily)
METTHESPDTVAMHPDEFPIPGSSGFPPTAWTALEKIKQSSAEERVERRNRFIEQYCKPVYYFLRAHRYSPDKAGEWTQAFFADLLGSEDFLKADRTRGLFRTFLLTLLKRFLSDQQNPARMPRQRFFEEGSVAISSFLTGEERSFEPPCHQTPETAFMRRWAQDLVASVKQQVKDLFDKRGQPQFYQLFEASQEEQPYGEKLTQEELGRRFDLDRDGVKYRLQQVKQAFMVKLRTAMRDQGCTEEEVDAEIGELLKLLQG